MNLKVCWSVLQFRAIALSGLMVSCRRYCRHTRNALVLSHMRHAEKDHDRILGALRRRRLVRFELWFDASDVSVNVVRNVNAP